MNDLERDILRKEILKLIRNGHDRWTSIEKRSCSIGFEFATCNTVKRQFYGYLLRFGYIERVCRGKYALTDRGRALLTLLSWLPKK